MVSAGESTLKRTFEESGLEDSASECDQNGTSPPTSGKAQKLNHLVDDAKVGNASVDVKKASLDCLPTEILNLIAAPLSTRELLSLRLTSRIIEKQLFNDFAAYYFAKKQFMLTEESLQCLLDISLHPKLSTVLEHVIISLDRYETGLHPDVFWTDDAGTALVRATSYGQGHYDQVAFLATAQDCDLLTRAFRNLPSLKTVGLRDYNSGQRWRDGERAEWRAYGATTVWKETGRMLPLRGDNEASTLFAARAVTTLLRALGSSGASPANLEILLRSASNGLPDQAFHLPKYLMPVVVPPLAGLKSLLIAVNLKQMAILTSNVVSRPSGLEVPDYALLHLLGLAPNLTHLRLNFQHDMSGRALRFLEQLAKTDTESDMQLLPKLAHLDFGMIRIDPALLKRVVRRFGSTLTAVSFWKVALAVDDQPTATLMLGRLAKPNEWAELLLQLPRLAPALSRISIGCLTQFHNYQHLRITFKARPQDEPDRPPATREYGPEDMRDLNRFKKLLKEELLLPETDVSRSSASEDSDGQ